MVANQYLHKTTPSFFNSQLAGGRYRPIFLFSHPTGNANSRAVVEAMYNHGLLEAFLTTISLSQDEPLLRFLPTGLRRQAARRAFPIPSNKIVRTPDREIVRQIVGKTKLMSHLTTHETGWASIDSVFGDLDHFTAQYLRRMGHRKNTLRGVYCYEDAAIQTFRQADTDGLLKIYDTSIAYWDVGRKLLEEEALRYPSWSGTLVGTRDSEAKYARKTEEIGMADVVVVPSGFVYDSLPEAIRANKICCVAPFGSPAVAPASESDNQQILADRPRLRVLFAGSMTQRKGLADVFAAFRLLNRSDVELVVLGSPVMPMEFYRQEFADFTYEPTRPNAEVLALMRTCDVFLLPSIVEGRALVQQEALACGLPLIVTPNAGGEDLIDEGMTGFLVPIRSPEKIAEKIAYLADHRDEIPHMRTRAIIKAASYTWRAYGDQVIAAITTAASAPEERLAS